MINPREGYFYGGRGQSAGRAVAGSTRSIDCMHAHMFIMDDILTLTSGNQKKVDL